MGEHDQIVNAIAALNKNVSALVLAINTVFPRITGSFTLAAAASTTVTQPAIAANSIILLIPTNAAAATLMGSAKSLFISARTAGASFAVSTASAAVAAGTETFSYVVVNPS